MEEVLGIFGEVGHSDLLHKAQRIKGNWRRQAGSLVTYQYGEAENKASTGRRGVKEEAVADGRNQMPQPQMQAAHFGR